MSLTRVAGIIAVVCGVLFLLYIFAWSTLMPPEMTGAAWWTQVLRTMVSRGAITGTALGTVCVVGGIFLLFLRSTTHRPSLIAVIVMTVLAVLIALGVAMS